MSENEVFIDTVLNATTYALKTSDDEKIKAFRDAILNTALTDSPDKTTIQIFLNLVDNFTSWHIRILYLFNDPKEWFKRKNIVFPNYISTGLDSVVTDAYPELKSQRELLNIIWDDLKERVFITQATWEQ